MNIRIAGLAAAALIGAGSIAFAAPPRISATDAVPPATMNVQTNASPQEKPLQVEDAHGRALGTPVGQVPVGNVLPLGSDPQYPGVVARRVNGTVVGLNIVRAGFVKAPSDGISVQWLTPYFQHESATCADPRYLRATDAPIRMAQVLGRDLTVFGPAAARAGYYGADPVQVRMIVAIEFGYDPLNEDCVGLGGAVTTPGFCCYLVTPYQAEVGRAVSFDLSTFDPPFAVK